MKRGNVGNLVLAWADGMPVDPPAVGAEASGAAEAARQEVPDDAAASQGIAAMPRADVLQYIGEMCDALAYMAREQRCNTLAELLHEAAAEAERGIASL